MNSDSERKHLEFMEAAVEEARNGLEHLHGGPFGAVVVRNGKIIGRGHNMVLSTNDPTAHAEMLAIREASQKVNSFDLSDCVIYTSCEPCPMCFAAVHWAKMRKMYYGCTKEDAAKIGFDDEYIYKVFRGTAEKLQVETVQLHRNACLVPFSEWEQLEDKIRY
ncbi:MAG: nucleoside deaminase [Spirochaetia bacterium]